MSKNSNVMVAVRIRPENRAVRKCLSVANSREISVGKRVFNYDHVFADNASQADIYTHCVKKLVDGCFKGYNATIFAYGQTGSGKTHSIVGLAQDEEDEGVIPRAIRHVYETLDTVHTGNTSRLVSVHVSFLEIYNEECRDLLHVDIPSRDIMIREDKDGRIFFTGAREEAVSSVNAAMKCLEMGNLQRTTGGTFMNASSSRSHAIFTISLELLEYQQEVSLSLSHEEKKDVDPEEDSTPRRNDKTNVDGRYIQSKLHLVDLAGSERAKRTGAEGLRLKESVGINQGLLALGKVIRALTINANANTNASAIDSVGNAIGNVSVKHNHVPYRESKLTRFLQDSLGGNSCTVMLACVSAADVNTHETLSTLTYAARARAVTNKVRANIKAAPIAAAGTGTGGGGGENASHSMDIESAVVSALRLQLAQMQQQMLQMRQEKDSMLKHNNNIGVGSKGGKGASVGMGIGIGMGATIGAADNSNSMLRSSINSLYDSINAGSFHAVGGELGRPKNGEDEGEGEENADISGVSATSQDKLTVAQLLPQLQDIQQGLEVALQDLGKEITGDRYYAQGTFWGLICASTASSEALEELLCQARSLSEAGQRLHLSMSSANGNVNSVRNSISDLNNLPSPRALSKNAGYVEMQQKEITKLKAELQECYDDLKRDEEIFQEKMKDLKKSRKNVKSLESANKALLEENQSQYQQIQKMLYDRDSVSVSVAESATATATMKAPSRAESKHSDLFLEDATDSNSDSKLAPSQVKAAAGIEPIDYSLYLDPEDDEEEDLQAKEEKAIRSEDPDLSHMLEVLVPDMDLAQLMEDLESIQSERDLLLVANQTVESRYRIVAEEAHAQKDDYEKKQKDLKKKLQELEVGIRLKQSCISDLVRAESEAAAAAEQHSANVRALERKTASLQAELSTLRANHARDVQVATEERSRLQFLEMRATEAEDELDALRKEARRQEKRAAQDRVATEQKREDLRKAEALSDDLLQLRNEYAKVSSQLEGNESAHRKALDRLTSQVSTHRKQAEESAAKIKQLETKNAELSSRLERNAKAAKDRSGNGHTSASSRAFVPVPGSVAFGSKMSTGVGTSASTRAEDKGGHALEQDSTVSAVGRGAGGRNAHFQGSQLSQGSSTSSGGRPRRALTSDWLLRRVDELTAARFARIEVKKLTARCTELARERKAVRVEADSLQKKVLGTSPASKRDKYLSQLAEIDSRLSKLTQIASQKVHGSKQQRDSEAVIAQLKQARVNVVTKMDNSNASASHCNEETEDSSRLHDLLDELETLDAEYDLNSMRLEEERRKISKGAPAATATDTAVGVGGAGKGEAEVSILAREIERRGDMDTSQLQLLLSISGALIDSRHRTSADAAEILELQCRLDEQDSKIEELNDMVSKSRGLNMQKIEQVRREAEDKEAFLLQQLRAAEARALETSNIMRKSHDAVVFTGHLPPSLLNVHRDSLARESLMNLNISRDSFSGDSTGAGSSQGKSVGTKKTGGKNYQRSTS